MKEIPLTQGKVALVDDEDFELVNQYKWHAHYSTNNPELCYARAYMKEKKRNIRLHRFLMSPPVGIEIDHINGNGLDNRRCNLRLATRSQNQANSKPRKGRFCKYKGVHRQKGYDKYIASITEEQKSIHLGVFSSEIDAARAYDKKAAELFGEFARLNFTD